MSVWAEGFSLAVISGCLFMFGGILCLICESKSRLSKAQAALNFIRNAILQSKSRLERGISKMTIAPFATNRLIRPMVT